MQSTEKEKNEDLNLDEEYIMLAAEASLFASGSAVSFDKLSSAIGVDENRIISALKELQKVYRERKTAIELLIFDGCAQFITKSEFGEIVRNTLILRKNQPLSKAALEVLAIIAYNQPTTRAFIDKVRGVESPSVVASLVEKGLIEEKGRLEAPGRPVLYGTTHVFLRTFGLSSLDELSEMPQFGEREPLSHLKDEQETQPSFPEDEAKSDEAKS